MASFSPPPEFGNGAATVLASDAAATKREASLFNLLFSFFNFSNSARIFLSTLLASFSFDTSATFDSSFVFVSVSLLLLKQSSFQVCLYEHVA